MMSYIYSTAVMMDNLQSYFRRVDSCSPKCQVTTCRVCIFTDQIVDMPEECVEEVCTNLKCVVKWSRCAYVKMLTFQVRWLASKIM